MNIRFIFSPRSSAKTSAASADILIPCIATALVQGAEAPGRKNQRGGSRRKILFDLFFIVIMELH